MDKVIESKAQSSVNNFAMDKSSSRVPKHKERDSAIELLKIVAMVAIVVSHVTQSLLPAGTSGGGSDLGQALAYCVDFRMASSDPSMWLLVCFKTLGQWGNTIFVICSAWFLCMSTRVRFDKVVKMVLEVFVISLAVLLLALLFGVRPGVKELVKCFFPITFANNWFITCYLLLYAIHPALNWVFEKFGKRGHAAFAVVLFGLYMLLPAVHGGHFYITEFMIMVAEYVVVAYGHYYLPETLASKKVGWGAFVVGIVGALGSIVLLELAGLHIGALSNKMLHFDVDGNPFLFLSAIGLFCLVKAHPFVSVRVNRVAPLMLLVYLIHENLIVRKYVRPDIWARIHDAMGYDALLVWLLLFSAALFCISLVLAILYKKTLGKGVNAFAPKVGAVVRNAGRVVLDRVCALR